MNNYCPRGGRNCCCSICKHSSRAHRPHGCVCPVCPIGAPGPAGPTGPTGAAGVAPTITVAGTVTGAPGTSASVTETLTPTGAELLFTIPAGATGPAGAIIPFCISKYGATLGTDEQGRPLMISFSGFGPSYYSDIHLSEGEWDSGTISILPDMPYANSFIMTKTSTLRKIYATFAVNGGEMTFGSTIQPFLGIVVSSSGDLVFTVIPSAIVYTEPYIGGIPYPDNSLSKGSLVDLDLEITEGSLVGIVAGIRAEGAAEAQNGIFSVSGGLYLE